MRKTELVKMMEELRDKKASQVYQSFTAAINSECQSIYDKFHLETISKDIADKVNDALVLLENWRNQHDGAVKNCDGYYGSMNYELHEFNSAENVENALRRHHINVTSNKLERLKAAQKEAEKKTFQAYDTVIENIKALPTVKAALEYLKTLGFDITDDIPKECTAISKPVDTNYLFINQEVK